MLLLKPKFFFLFFICLVFAGVSAKAEELCDDAQIAELVQREMSFPDKSKRAESVLRQVEIGVSKGLLKAEQRKNAEEAILEYSIRHSKKCPIPQSLRGRIHDVVAITKADAQPCAKGQFETVVNRQHRTLKSAGGYPMFEELIKAQIEANVIADAKEAFSLKWSSDPAFRDRVIRAGLEVNTMFASNCKNIADPILDIIEDF